MTPEGRRILDHLLAVEREREARRRDMALAGRVQAVKAYQQERFRRTYADLLAQPGYRDAAGFFLEELYGPGDFSARDAQFARIVPALTRLFPDEIVSTVERLAALHAVSEALDTHMGRQVANASISAVEYVRAWQATDRRDDRRAQIALTLDIGRRLDRFTRNPMMRHSLRMMRAPARGAGLAALQSFLERGFEAFRAMQGAEHFLSVVSEREQALCELLFTLDPAHVGASPGSPSDLLGQLP